MEQDAEEQRVFFAFGENRVSPCVNGSGNFVFRLTRAQLRSVARKLPNITALRDYQTAFGVARSLVSSFISEHIVLLCKRKRASTEQRYRRVTATRAAAIFIPRAKYHTVQLPAKFRRKISFRRAVPIRNSG